MDAVGLKALNLRPAPASLRHRVAPPLFRGRTSASPPLLSLPSILQPASRFSSSQRRHVTSDSNSVVDNSGGVSSHQGLLQVVLVSPQIPGNTGSIARTCAASAVGLHLVEPLGYTVDDTKLKRAGLDYWPYVVVKIHGSWSKFLDYFRQQDGEKRLLAFTKRGTHIHSDFSYKRGDWLVFGSETCGLPAEAMANCSSGDFGGGTIRIPMVETYVRCLNLSVSVGIALYEAARQLNYEHLQIPIGPSTENQTLFSSEDIFA